MSAPLLRKLALAISTCALVTQAVSCTRRPVEDGAPRGIRDAVLDHNFDQPPVNGIDLLLVIDDSVSMDDKQEMLARSLEGLMGTAGACYPPSESGLGSPTLPSTDGTCPEGWGFSALLPPVRSAAVISTSLEAAGACVESSRGAYPVASQSVGSNPHSYIESVQDVGSSGCGFEAPLEAMYRFLVDPAPPLSIVRAQSSTGRDIVLASGIDEELLALRQRFLSPYSTLVIVILTDEDDCSVRDEGDAYKVGSTSPLARASAVCESDPGSECCRSCDADEEQPPDGCLPLSEDPVCAESPLWDSEQDTMNLRCFDQKRRFGESYLFPVERYIKALTEPEIEGRDGEFVSNPLFSGGRTQDMVSVLLLAGVPWQLIAKDANGQQLQLKTPNDYAAEGLWESILGDPGTFQPPSDPHLVQAVLPREGLPLAGETWDPIHGHEVAWGSAPDLQFSCIFDLPSERTCASGSYCPCNDPSTDSPLCWDDVQSYDEVQRRAQAYPPLRLLELSRALGERGLVGSICPRSVDSEGGIDFNFGYGAAFALLAQGSHGNQFFNFDCFASKLPVGANGVPNCHLIEAYVGERSCEEIGRRVAPSRFTEPLRKAFASSDAHEAKGLTFCEVPAFDGDASTEGSDYYRCAHDLHPTFEEPGYCYIDLSLDLGDPSLLSGCITSHARRVRIIPQVYPFLDAGRVMMCDYGER